jgi:hypothetical protein
VKHFLVVNNFHAGNAVNPSQPEDLTENLATL